MVLETTSAKMVTDGADTQALDVLLETIVQVQTTQSRELLHAEALNVIERLVEAFCGKKKTSEDIQASDFAFTIELASQLCL